MDKMIAALEAELKMRRADLASLTNSVADLVAANNDAKPSRHFGANLVAKAADIVELQGQIASVEATLRFAQEAK